MAYQEKCTKCGEYWWTDKAHFCRAKETRSGSPLESVVQGRSESPAPLNPDRSGHAIILEKIRDWLETEYDIALRQRTDAKISRLYDLAKVHDSYARAMCKVLSKIDEFSTEEDNTAPDTTSGSAGVP